MEANKKRALPAFTTASIDNAAFSAVRTEFMADFFAFQQGEILKGGEAMTHLLAMYYVLPMARHLKTNQAEAIAFLDEVGKIQSELREYLNTHDVNEQGKVFDAELLKKTNEIVRKFYIILADLGYSG